MKINPEKIILESKDFHFKKKIFLISGNEETLIKKICQLKYEDEKRANEERIVLEVDCG